MKEYIEHENAISECILCIEDCCNMLYYFKLY